MGIIVNYKNVEIDRAEKNVLKDVTFTLSKGDFYYLVGRVGSGKSSLMKTIYADVPIRSGDKAEVLDFDILNIKKSQIPYLRRKVGIVFQDFQLLQDRSVSGNLKFVLNATGWKNRDEIENRIEEVLNMVGMANKSYKMPHELSGGEQQRIVIARALLKDANVNLLDEATSFLDVENESKIQKALSELIKNKTVIIIAHRMRTIANADRIVVLDDGKIVEQGMPEELIADNGLFKKIVDLQNLSGEWQI